MYKIVKEKLSPRIDFLSEGVRFGISQEMIFDFRGADLFYRIKKISWDSTRRTAHDNLLLLPRPTTNFLSEW